MDIEIVLDSTLSPDQLTDLGLLAEQYEIRTIWNASHLDGGDPNGGFFYCNATGKLWSASLCHV